MYVAGYGASAVGVVVMGRAVGDPLFTVLALVLMAVGFMASSAVRTGRLPRQMAEGVLLFALVLGTLLVLINPGFRYAVLPLHALASSDLVLATILVWLMVVYSFNLRTDRAVLFMCVPPLSLLGMMSTFDPSGQPIVYFILYLCFASFVLIHQNALSQAAPAEHRRVRGNLKMAVVITVQAVAVGGILGWALGAVLERTAGPSLLARRAQPIRESYLDSNFLEVATGPTILGDEEVMTVSCNEDLLWRSQVYDRYTGHGWISTLPPGVQPELIASPGQMTAQSKPDRFPSFPSCFSIPQDAESANRRRVKTVDQVFRVKRGRIMRVYGAAEPVLVAFRGPQLLFSANGRISMRVPYSRGGAYAVSSLVSTATARELRRAPGYYPEEIKRRYVDQYPDDCRQIEPILEELVGAMPTTYDKVIAIRNYLETGYTYDLTAPAAPQHEDAVVHFLLKSKRGYCDVFASSMAVMCRLSGIPARVAVGYATGKREPGEDVYHVRQRDRHAWVEVYFPGHGWITFDPAPQEARSSLTSRFKSLWAEAVSAVSSQSSSFWMYALLFCLIAYLLKVEGLDRLLRARNIARRQPHSVGRASENYRRMCDAFGRLGYARSPSMTPREYCLGLERVLATNCAGLVPKVQAVTEDFVEARYAGRELPRDRISETSLALSSLVREARRAAKQKLLPECGDLIG